LQLFEIPKIVTSKLAEREANLRAGAGLHPEADLLTAFVERVLPERERSTVMKHLATCAACREIVALAQPEEVATGGVLIRARPRVWRGLLLRWGALAACAALAVSVVIFHKKGANQALVAEKRVSEPVPPPPVSRDAEFGDANKPAAEAQLRAEPKSASQPAAPQMGADAVIATYSRAKRPGVPGVPGPRR
jgi:hypothetical protein